MKKCIFIIISLIALIVIVLLFKDKIANYTKFKLFETKILQYQDSTDFLDLSEFDKIKNSLNANPEYIDFLIERYSSPSCKAGHKDVILYIFSDMARENKIPESKKNTLIEFFRKCMFDKTRVELYGGKGWEIRTKAVFGLMGMADKRLKNDFIKMTKDENKFIFKAGVVGLLKINQEDELFKLLIAKEQAGDIKIDEIIAFLKKHKQAKKFEPFILRLQQYVNEKQNIDANPVDNQRVD